jgi:hypothetical protein
MPVCAEAGEAVHIPTQPNCVSPDVLVITFVQVNPPTLEEMVIGISVVEPVSPVANATKRSLALQLKEAVVFDATATQPQFATSASVMNVGAGTTFSGT